MSMKYHLRAFYEDGEFLEPVARMPFEMGPRHEDVDTGPESLTKQEFVDEADINNIMARYRVTGLLPQLQDEAIFGDFANMPDYEQALQMVVAADEAFEALPSDVRAKFDNDPAKFVAFCDEAGHDAELIEMGLTSPKTVSDVDRLIAAVEKAGKPVDPTIAPVTEPVK